MYTMKQVGEITGISYETLRFYCNEGLVPNVLRDHNNYRMFDEKNLAWIESLKCLRKCGMGIKEMKEYMNYCLLGPSSIQERIEMLNIQKIQLLEQLKDIQDSLDYIDHKEKLYGDILAGKVQYTSNLIDIE